MYNVTVVRGGDLQQTIWRFWFNDSRMQLALDAYAVQERPSKRHKWQSVQEWSRYKQDRQVLKRNAIEIPDDVGTEALRQVREKITLE